MEVEGGEAVVALVTIEARGSSRIIHKNWPLALLLGPLRKETMNKTSLEKTTQNSYAS